MPCAHPARPRHPRSRLKPAMLIDHPRRARAGRLSRAVQSGSVLSTGLLYLVRRSHCRSRGPGEAERMPNKPGTLLPPVTGLSPHRLREGPVAQGGSVGKCRSAAALVRACHAPTVMVRRRHDHPRRRPLPAHTAMPSRRGQPERSPGKTTNVDGRPPPTMTAKNESGDSFHPDRPHPTLRRLRARGGEMARRREEGGACLFGRARYLGHPQMAPGDLSLRGGDVHRRSRPGRGARTGAAARPSRPGCARSISTICARSSCATSSFRCSAPTRSTRAATCSAPRSRGR